MATDTDGDALPDFADACPESDLNPTIAIAGCDSGVPNELFDDGCTMSDLIMQCADGASNHGAFNSCVSQLTNGWRRAGLITGAQKGAIQSCSGQASSDMNADGYVGIDDLLILLAEWGGAIGVLYDVDGDGVAGIAELMHMLSRWNPGPTS